jgi:uncharacterized protein YyaL (SSP411 family)
METPAPRNRLGDESSPYLRQHADNPVNWLTWGEEALELARAEDKPILLSIGYSACHWCHVMAHESFEDNATAALMNQHFINIKVDREERPDLDKIYQVAHQFLTQRPGGWPLTMFLTADDQTPFFGGTYFPPEPRHCMPGFAEVLRRVAEYYREHRGEIRAQTAAVRETYTKLVPPPMAADEALDPALLDQAREELEKSFDSRHGGFGHAPKFPHPTSIDRLLRHWRAGAGGEEPDVRGLFMATFTLQRMARGGLYDQLGGGFYRYSVDERWNIPHFEKMLYDNGPLLALYAQAWRASGDEFYRAIANGTADWVISEMQAADGGYYATLDADSEGEEGKFYVWSKEEIEAVLDPDEYALFAPVYGLDRQPNFEGAWHLYVASDAAEIGAAMQLTPGAAQRRLTAAARRLLDKRSDRVRPTRDEKILTGWNGLMIRGMAIAARALERPDLAASAHRAVEFVRANLWQDDRLLAVCTDGRAHLPAYLDDYAYLADGLLELLQTDWRTTYLEWAIQLADGLLAHFEDKRDGGFFFTADDHERLVHRTKTFSDDATPAGAGIAAQVLVRLGHFLARVDYLEAAERCLRAGWAALERYPSAHGAMLNALDELIHPGEIVILRGDSLALADWRAVAEMLYSPSRMVFSIGADEPDLPTAIAQRTARDGPVAYICRGSHCTAPITSLENLAAELDGAAGTGPA